MSHIEPPSDTHFDESLGAWVVSRYADVNAVLRDARFAAPGTPVHDAHETSRDGSHDDSRGVVRNAIAHAMSAEQLDAWRHDLLSDARLVVQSIPMHTPVDLVGAFAKPWSLRLACRVTGVSTTDAIRCDALARAIFESASQSIDGNVQHAAAKAAAELVTIATMPGDVQTFVALSQTLPCLLAGAWLMLLDDAGAMSALRRDQSLMQRAAGELLRMAGPSRAIFRIAHADADAASAHIRAADRVILMLARANRDPSRFEHPDRLDFSRATQSHLAFGAGPHACAGAGLIRLALAVATQPLVESPTSFMELAGNVEWIGGFAIRGLASLPVVLRHSTVS